VEPRPSHTTLDRVNPFRKPEMGAVLMMVSNIVREQSLQMMFIQRLWNLAQIAYFHDAGQSKKRLLLLDQRFSRSFRRASPDLRLRSIARVSELSTYSGQMSGPL
jgi:hypothetical protein